MAQIAPVVPGDASQTAALAGGSCETWNRRRRRRVGRRGICSRRAKML